MRLQLTFMYTTCDTTQLLELFFMFLVIVCTVFWGLNSI